MEKTVAAWALKMLEGEVLEVLVKKGRTKTGSWHYWFLKDIAPAVGLDADITNGVLRRLVAQGLIMERHHRWAITAEGVKRVTG